MLFDAEDIQKCDREMIVPITFYSGWIIVPDIKTKESFINNINKLIKGEKVVALPSEYEGYLRWQPFDTSYHHGYWMVFTPTLVYWSSFIMSFGLSLKIMYKINKEAKKCVL